MTNDARPNRVCARAMSVLAVSALAVGLAACSDEEPIIDTTTSAEETTTDSVATSAEPDTTTDTTTSEETTNITAGSGDPESSITDPCGLLSEEELRELGATDDSLGYIRPDEFGSFPGCEFGAFASVYYNLTEGWMGSDDADAEPVSGVGDEAYFDRDWNRLTVRFGEERLMFQMGLIGRMDVEDVETTLIAMAEMVEPKL